MTCFISALILLSVINDGVCQNGDCVEDTSVMFSNLALNKPATQSSLYQGGYDNGVQGFAWRANDGDKNSNYRDGSCSHVAGIVDNHWWQVDLQGTYNVTSVAVVNRDVKGKVLPVTKVTLGHRLSDFGIEVSFSDQDDGDGRLKEAKLCHHHEGGGIANGEERTFPCIAGAVGQYVRIYKPSPTDKYNVLTLCEVEISGYKLICGLTSTSASTTTDVTSTSSSTTVDVTSTSSSSTTTDVTSTSSSTTSDVTSTSSSSSTTTDITSTPSSTTVDVTSTSSSTTTDVTSTSSSSTTTDVTSTSSSSTTDVTSTSSSTTMVLASTSSQSDVFLHTSETTGPISCYCRCVNKTVPTMSELVERVTQLKKQLTVKKDKTSSYRRKLVSAPDSRTSAKNIGVVLGAGVLVFIFGSIVVMDLVRLLKFFRSLCKKRKDNLISI